RADGEQGAVPRAKAADELGFRRARIGGHGGSARMPAPPPGAGGGGALKLLLLLEGDDGVGAAGGGGDDDARPALAVVGLAGDRAAGLAAGREGALLRLQAGALELSLVIVEHLVRGVLGGDGERCGAAVVAGGVVGP